ncbi:hypothetical protein TBK1r_50650 [Stieleria magnilauensis]|uniref:B box-type domain-containing protein n=1 Tax=Stieleria magnilauensis TaxID=2527963 RepID=A0ABX5XVI4_9BACT|nr:hypothetical protein TBK1r_50650 [Planctomycetes bacterium TBK1r]
MKPFCQHCSTRYGELLRSDRWRGFRCETCNTESCELCVVSEDLGNHIAFLRCPSCGGDSLDDLDLHDRHSIFTSTEQLTSLDIGIALPWITWSVYPRRTEALIQKSLPRLSDYGPRFALLDENEPKVRAYLAQAFPDRFNCDTPQGSGALIWIADGKPIQCSGGPNVTEYEILKTSRSLWAAVTD